MKLNFEYNKEKDIWCLLNKGKSSINSPMPTAVYLQLIASAGDNPNKVATAKFIDHYLQENNYNIPAYIENCRRGFGIIVEDFERVAERIFMIALDKEIIAYITVNNRCPYSIEKNWFFVSIPRKSPMLNILHELWHFYTWYKFGVIWEEKLGKQKYNDLKEALTVLLNIECKDLLPENVEDTGYPQHKELREKILEEWNKTKDIEEVWDVLVKSA